MVKAMPRFMWRSQLLVCKLKRSALSNFARRSFMTSLMNFLMRAFFTIHSSKKDLFWNRMWYIAINHVLQRFDKFDCTQLSGSSHFSKTFKLKASCYFGQPCFFPLLQVKDPLVNDFQTDISEDSTLACLVFT